MDVGVGAFVFSSGVVNSKAKKLNLSSFGLLMKSLKDSMPLWILGIVRLISVKGLEYQVS
jgi:phosphatidylinositol glycan class W